MSNAKPSDHVIERAQLWVCANCSEPEIENALLEALLFYDRIVRARPRTVEGGAAAALLDVGDGWRSIESAPHDTTVLGVVDGDVRLIRWGKTSHVPLYGWNLADQGVEDFDICHPTLWQPLPPPPKAAPSGDEGA